MNGLKRILVLMFALILLCTSSAYAAKKEKATPTPAPMTIQAEPADPPEQIQRVLDIAYEEWTTVNGKDQGIKNKYTTWFNNYNWGRNSWCAGFVTWCMLEAGIPQEVQDEVRKWEEGTCPDPVFHVKGSAPKKMAPELSHAAQGLYSPQKRSIQSSSPIRRCKNGNGSWRQPPKEKLNEVSLYQDDKGKSEVEIDKRSER